VIALKANQGTLYEQSKDYMEKNHSILPVYETLDNDHNRGEQRRVYVADNIELVNEAQYWNTLRSVVMVERIRHTDKGTNRQVPFYSSSLQTSAEQMAH